MKEWVALHNHTATKQSNAFVEFALTRINIVKCTLPREIVRDFPMILCKRQDFYDLTLDNSKGKDMQTSVKYNIAAIPRVVVELGVLTGDHDSSICRRTSQTLKYQNNQGYRRGKSALQLRLYRLPSALAYEQINITRKSWTRG